MGIGNAAFIGIFSAAQQPGGRHRRPAAGGRRHGDRPDRRRGRSGSRPGGCRAARHGRRGPLGGGGRAAYRRGRPVARRSDAAAEEMAAQLATAQARADQAEAVCVAAEAERDAAIEAARAEAGTRIAAAEAERDTAIAQVRAEAAQQVSVAAADRGQAPARAAEGEQAARLAQQDAARAQAAEASRPGRDRPGPRRRGQDAGLLSAPSATGTATSCAPTCGLAPSAPNARGRRLPRRTSPAPRRERPRHRITASRTSRRTTHADQQ